MQRNSTTNIFSGTSTDPFSFGGQTMEETFTRFVDQNPIWVLHARRDTRFPCPKCNANGIENPKNDIWCAACLGTGYKLVINRMKCRLEVKSRLIESEPERIARITEPGVMDSYNVILFTDSKTFVSPRDLILDCEWDVNIPDIPLRGKPVRLNNVYEVEVRIAMRQSRVTYFVSGCITYSFEKDRIQQALIG